MKTVSISGSLRANVGKKDAKALRASNSVPGVLYGGKEQVHFSAKVSEFRPLLFSPDAATVNLTVGDNTYNAILREAQYHVVTDDLLHIDLFEITPGKPVTMEIPVVAKGVSPGVKAGGRLVKKLKTLKLNALIEKMPDTVDVSIEELNIGDSVRAGAIDIDGVEVINSPNVSVIAVQTTRVSASAAAAEADAPEEATEEAAAE